MRVLTFNSQARQHRSTKNRINRAKQISSLLLALVYLMFGLASPTLCLFHQSSNDAITPPETDPVWVLTGALGTNRFSHTATLLKNGKVLVVGGGGWRCVGGSCISRVNGSAELYDPDTEMWSFAGSPGRRESHSATLLQNGEVLVAGGVNYGFDIGKFEFLNSAKLYDPTSGRWRRTGKFNEIEGYNSATLLANGYVLAIGHSNLDTDRVALNAELYNPATGEWSITAAPSIVGPLTLLPNGKALVVSGNAAELYDPATESWSSAGNLKVIRSPRTATLLANGKVLVTGTYDYDNGEASGAELFDPATGEWSVTGGPTRARDTATLLPDGRVLMAGGYNSLNLVSGEEIYDPSTGTWSLTSRLKTARDLHTATLLEDGRVLVTGGIDGDGDIGTIYHESAELYGPLLSPRINSASVAGKRLYLQGEDFDLGAVILLNGVEQKTMNDGASPRSALLSKKAGKKIRAGDIIQVRNRNGTLSEVFIFTGTQSEAIVER